MEDESLLEKNLEKGYQEYLLLPKYSRTSKVENIYDKEWCVYLGLACIAPHPHRHYTFVEFAFFCGKNKDLFERFCKTK